MLLNRGLPGSVVHFMSSWYQAQQDGGTIHYLTRFVSLIRQCGVLLPILFAVYVNGLLGMLESSGVGCYYGGCFVGALAYADDNCFTGSLRISTKADVAHL